jgi:hypothetical protein
MASLLGSNEREGGCVVRSILSRRILLVLVVGVILAVTIIGSASFSGAQPSEGGPTCSSQWFKDWYVWESSEDEPWLYFWWYQYCKDPSQQDGWFKAYHSWEWGSAM